MLRALGLTAWVRVIFIVGSLAVPQASRGDDTKATTKPGIDAKTAFARLKTMAGTWKSQSTSVIYKLTGAGSAVMETQFPGTGHEMVSIYHLNGEDLLMTHYCAIGNQPRVKLDRVNSKPDELIFVFDGGTNFDPQKDHHIHGLKITFHENDKVTSDWESYAEGKKEGTANFFMTRQKAQTAPKITGTTTK